MMVEEVLIAIPGLAAFTVAITCSVSNYGWGTVLVAAVAIPSALGTCWRVALAVASLREGARA